MPIATQLIVTLENKPGTLAQVAGLLGEGGVNIKGFSAPAAVEADGRKGEIRLLVAEMEKARTILSTHKIGFREEEVLVLSLENKPGALSHVVDHLKEAQINIESGYCTPSREGKRAIVVLSVSDTKKAHEILKVESLDEI
jgi:hypothetical protein